MTDFRDDDPRAYRVRWWSLRDPRIGSTAPERRPYLSIEEAEKAVAAKLAKGGLHAERVGPFFDGRSQEQRQRDDLLAAVIAFIGQADRADFKDGRGQELTANKRFQELRVLTLR
jgi:hypothetical protein